jgi:CheY-like chemotaxis protein
LNGLPARTKPLYEAGAIVLKPILLVEDNPRDLELSLAALEKSKLANEVIVARDGEEARDYLFRKGDHTERAMGLPAVVLLDLKLPKIDGLELLAMIRKDEALANLPVVMLTSSREERDVISSYKLGVNAFVVKPVEFSEFLKAVQDLGVFWAVLNEPPPGSLRVFRDGNF